LVETGARSALVVRNWEALIYVDIRMPGRAARSMMDGLRAITISMNAQGEGAKLSTFSRLT
jgi:hypothetical protein